jgi:sporulation protein YlmC with PRC-barrel domain
MRIPVYIFMQADPQEMIMSYTAAHRDTYGMYRRHAGTGAVPPMMGIRTLIGEEVYDNNDEYLGDIKEIMLEMDTGKAAYAMLSFGDFIGMHEHLYAVPWDALKLDTVNERFMLSFGKERLKDAPAFHKDDWPDMSDNVWASVVRGYYGVPLP